MSIYFEKARELGNLILESDQAQMLKEASTTFKENEEAVARLEEYKAYQRNIGESIQSGILPKEDMQVATQRLTEMAAELKQDPVIGALIFAENEFNGFVNQVMSVLKQTIMGDEGQCDKQSCGGSCSGCK